MTNEEAISVIENEIQIDVRLCTGEQVDRFQTALYMAISALRAEPTGDPLTLEQLREMDGRPVRMEDLTGGTLWNQWIIFERHTDDGFIPRGGGYFGCDSYGVKWLAYAYPPAHIDRDAWTAEWKDHYKSGVHAGTGAICSSCDVWNERKTHICPFCGKAMDEDGFAMLEKRMGVR